MERLKKGDIVFAQWSSEHNLFARYKKGKLTILRVYKYKYFVEVLSGGEPYTDTVEIVRVYSEEEWEKMDKEKAFRDKYLVGQSSPSLEKILEDTEKRANELRSQVAKLDELTERIREFVKSEKEAGI